MKEDYIKLIGTIFTLCSLAGCSTINVEDACSCEGGDMVSTETSWGRFDQCQVEIENNHWVTRGNYCEYDLQGRLSISGEWKDLEMVGKWYQYEYSLFGTQRSALIIDSPESE